KHDPPSTLLPPLFASVPHPLASTSPAHLQSPKEFPACWHPASLFRHRTSLSSRPSDPVLLSISPPLSPAKSPPPPTSAPICPAPISTRRSSRQIPRAHRLFSLSSNWRQCSVSASRLHRTAPQQSPTAPPLFHLLFR